MDFLFPIRAPIIEAIIDSSHPPNKGIQKDGSFQKPDFKVAKMIPTKLVMTGTYQILLGFCLTINKFKITIIDKYRVNGMIVEPIISSSCLANVKNPYITT